ncbi:MAG: hypothetical protein ACREKH_17410 [Candidatus Rokuibacteriota bacterium]
MASVREHYDEVLSQHYSLFASDDLSMTCFLEYEPAGVNVHDLIWVRGLTAGGSARASTASCGSGPTP